MRTIIRTNDDRRKFIKKIKKLKLTRPFLAVFEIHRQKRSIPQNKLFHMHMAVLEKETGTSREVWKDHYKRKFLEVYLDECFGEQVTTVRGTSDLNTKEFTDFVDKYRLDASENGIFLPLPDDQGWDDFYLEHRDNIYVR